jgi:biotin synthase
LSDFTKNGYYQVAYVNRGELLNAAGEAQQRLHDGARAQRDARFGRTVFVRGVVEISNYCRQNCYYCAMRRDNRALDRYRLSLEELLDLILYHRPTSVTDIDLQAGEDPVIVRDVVVPLVRELRQQTNLGITLCLGLLTSRQYDELREAGADYYVMKLETGDAAHYETIAAPGTLAERIDAIRYLASSGWNVSSGLIIGLPGQTPAVIAQSLDLLHSLPLAGCSVSPFIAGEDTPFDHKPNGSLETTLNALALMRTRTPQWIIPAVSAMRLLAADGYVRALSAGANLSTINLTPRRQREHYPIYKHNRFIMDEQRVLTAIDEAGCKPSPISLSEYFRSPAAATLAQ